MPEIDAKLSCEQVCDELEAFLDGEVAPDRTRLIEEHLSGCADCAAEHALALESVGMLRQLPIISCPQAVVASAYERIDSLTRPVRRPWWQIVWRPALAMGVAGLLLWVTGLVGRQHVPDRQLYSSAQIESARAEARWTLIYIGQLSHKSAAVLREELSDPNLAAPLRYLNRNEKKTSKENEHAG
jgi:anti-sigma factor RsiW